MIQTNNTIIAKVLKYILMALVVVVATRYIPDITLKNKEIIMIGAISGITFAILDMVSPSVCIKNNQSNNKVIVEKFI